MNYKVIITGSVGSGKTTAVNSLTSKDAVLTDAVVSGADQATRQRKETTTVAMDYDVIRLNDQDVVHVYGTPGQERFDFMWDILSKGAHGVIILLDVTRNYPFRDLKYYTGRFADLIDSSRLIIGLTHADIEKNFSTETYKQSLRRMKLEGEVVPIDARDKDDVTLLFHTLLDIPHEKKLHVLESKTETDALAEVETKSKTEPKLEPKTKPKAKTQDIGIKPPKIVEKPHKIEKRKADRRSQKVSSDLLEPISTDNEKNNIETDFEPDVAINLTENMLHEVAKVEHVNGVSLTNSMGELLHTTIEDEELNEFIAFLSGITPEIETGLGKGKIRRIMLRSPMDDNLTLLVEDEKSLGVCSDRIKSVQALSQQIEDVLQWL